MLIAMTYTQSLKYEHLEVGCYDDTPPSARAKFPSKKSQSDTGNVCYKLHCLFETIKTFYIHLQITVCLSKSTCVVHANTTVVPPQPNSQLVIVFSSDRPAEEQP